MSLCSKDQKRWCPHLGSPFTEQELFTAACFVEHSHHLSPQCKLLYVEFQRESFLPHTPTPDSMLGSVCHGDLLAFCRHISPPYTYSRLFQHPCFLDHRAELSQPCRKMMDDYLRSHVKLAPLLVNFVLLFTLLSFGAVVMALACCACFCCLCRIRGRRRCRMVKAARQAKRDLEELKFETTEMAPVDMYSYVPMSLPYPSPIAPGLEGQVSPSQYVVMFPQQFAVPQQQ